MINKAFDIVNDKVFKALKPLEYSKNSVSSGNENELVSLYTGKDRAYSIVYDKDRKHMILRSCTMTEGQPDNDWKNVSKWIFDPASDTEKHAEDIGNDFAETVGAPVRILENTHQRKKKDDDGNGDPLFFCKRLVAVFPQLKEEIKFEETHHTSFRAVTFAKEHLIDKINLLLTSKDKTNIKKLGSVLSNQYIYGNLDVRSVITIVILNNINEENEEILREYLSDDLKKAWLYAKKIKNKKIKPENPKKNKRSFLADTLNAR